MNFSLRSTTTQTGQEVEKLLTRVGKRHPGQLQFWKNNTNDIAGIAEFEAVQEIVLDVQGELDIPEGAWVCLEIPQLVDGYGETSKILVNRNRAYSFDPNRLDRVRLNKQREILYGLAQFT